MTIFMENKELVAMTIILLLLSILCRFITGIFMNSLIREAENMSTTQNRLLKQCKVKFRNCYKLNDGVPNIGAFVDKFLGKIQIGRFSVDGIAHLSGQLMLLSIVAAGSGACMGIIDGKTLGEILPFYFMSFLGLYLYFSVSGLVDLDGKKEMLKVSLTDYLENHMVARLAVLEESELAAEGIVLEDGNGQEARASAGERAVTGERNVRSAAGERSARAAGMPEQAVQAMKLMRDSGEAAPVTEKSAAERQTEEQMFSKSQEKELEELLKEFFA